MKKFLLMILTVIVTFSLIACSKEPTKKPAAEWADEYIAGKAISQSKLNYFDEQFDLGKDIGAKFRSYCDEHGIMFEYTQDDDITFTEGRQLKNGDFVLITPSYLWSGYPIAIRFKQIDKNTIEMVDVAKAIYINAEGFVE